MIQKDPQQFPTRTRDLRKFGLLAGGMLSVWGVLMWVRGKPHFPWLLGPGTILVAWGLIFPRSLKGVYVAWMSLAIALGLVVSNVVLTLLFLLVITPIGLTARLFRKDFLRLQVRRETPTYWIRRERAAQPKSDYERQF
jgi:hypothetical protein